MGVCNNVGNAALIWYLNKWNFKGKVYTAVGQFQNTIFYIWKIIWSKRWWYLASYMETHGNLWSSS